MEKLIYRNLNEQEIWDIIIDKKSDHILLHEFNPNYTLEWWLASIKLKNDIKLNNILVRNMCLDIQTNLSVLKTILDLNTLYLSVYQFDKIISGTLILQDLPEKNKENILKQNGLKHIIENDIEDTIIQSFDKNFIDNIRQNNIISNRLIYDSMKDQRPI